MEGIVKRNYNYAIGNYDFSNSNDSMRPYSSSDSHYHQGTNRGPNRTQLCNIQQEHIEDNIHYSNGVQIPNNCHYSPKKSELEKLFSHATEVKGDLESVIHALVDIIGNGSAEPCHPTDQVIHESTMESQSLPRNDYLSDIPSSNYVSDYNCQWQTDNTPSVNVENVLKNVRANKLKYEKFQLYNDGSQSSGSSKERLVVDKMDFNMNLQSTNSYKDSFRSIDSAHLDKSKPLLNELDNPRKHKSMYSKSYKDDGLWNSSELCVKKIRSVKPGNDFSDEVSPIQFDNIHACNEPMTTETNHLWTNINQMGPNNQYPENRCKFNWNIKEIPNPIIGNSDCNLYRSISNYNWSPGKDLLNDFSGNVYIDEPPCSSWPKISKNNYQMNNGNANLIKSKETNFDKQTPSVSVSDSEGSIEPVRDPPVKRIPRLPSLCTQLRSKQGQYELVLLNQPEQQHRARYMTEGSRGAVKDRSGNGYPTVQLFGWKKPATLQIFVGSEDGRVKPHNFYQACKVSGKQVLSCKERVFDNAGMIEVQLEAKDNQAIILDCIGILKLRNVDVERRAGILRIKQKSTMARLVFRVNLPHGDGYFTCLQVTSDPILCTQPVGTPEISKMSLCEGSCKGNMELFIIGKNIIKSCQVLFQEYSERRTMQWQAEAKIDTEYLQQNHLICTVPPYCDEKLKAPITVQVVLNCSGRLSEPRYFIYNPEADDNSEAFVKPFKFTDWKIDRSNISDPTSFSIENCSSNLDIPSLGRNDNLSKATNDNLYGVGCMKSHENLFNQRQLFTPISDEENYSHLISLNKMQNEFPVPRMHWIQSNSTKDVTRSVGSLSNERFSNSLDSDIENECIIKESSILSVPPSHSKSNFGESNAI